MQVCTSLQTDNHASTPPLSFLQTGCPSCRPTNSVQTLIETHKHIYIQSKNQKSNQGCIMPRSLAEFIQFKHGSWQRRCYLFWFRRQGWRTGLQTRCGSMIWHSCLTGHGPHWTHGSLLPMHCEAPRASVHRYSLTIKIAKKYIITTTTIPFPGQPR